MQNDHQSAAVPDKSDQGCVSLSSSCASALGDTDLFHEREQNGGRKARETL